MRTDSVTPEALELERAALAFEIDRFHAKYAAEGWRYYVAHHPLAWQAILRYKDEAGLEKWRGRAWDKLPNDGGVVITDVTDEVPLLHTEAHNLTQKERHIVRIVWTPTAVGRRLTLVPDPQLAADGQIPEALERFPDVETKDPTTYWAPLGPHFDLTASIEKTSDLLPMGLRPSPYQPDFVLEHCSNCGRQEPGPVAPLPMAPCPHCGAPRNQNKPRWILERREWP